MYVVAKYYMFFSVIVLYQLPESHLILRSLNDMYGNCGK